MVYVSNATEKPWFNPDRYTVTVTNSDIRCIAPTLKRGSPRCLRKCYEGKDEIKKILDEFKECIDEDEIVRKVRKLVLLRCCSLGNHSHQLKLQTDVKCRNVIAEKYIEALQHKPSHFKIKVRQGLFVADEGDIDGSRVVAYDTDLEEKIKDVLLRGVRKGEPSTGVIYAFSLPKHPELVKIGYSEKSCQSRLLDLKDCMPNAEMIIEKKISYPKRIEKLIHLELQSRRRKIIRCYACNAGHEEFFAMETDEVVRVMEYWNLLCERQVLYDGNGNVKKLWHQRLKGKEMVITGESLLKLSNDEVKEETGSGGIEHVVVIQQDLKRSNDNVVVVKLERLEEAETAMKSKVKPLHNVRKSRPDMYAQERKATTTTPRKVTGNTTMARKDTGNTTTAVTDNRAAKIVDSLVISLLNETMLKQQADSGKTRTLVKKEPSRTMIPCQT